MNNNKNNVGLIIQAVLAVAVVAFSIFYLLEKQFLIILQALTALFMFVLAYNNHITYKRNKWYTITYIIVGILIIGAMVF